VEKPATIIIDHSHASQHDIPSLMQQVIREILKSIREQKFAFISLATVCGIFVVLDTMSLGSRQILDILILPFVWVAATLATLTLTLIITTHPLHTETKFLRKQPAFCRVIFLSNLFIAAIIYFLLGLTWLLVPVLTPELDATHFIIQFLVTATPLITIPFVTATFLKYRWQCLAFIAGLILIVIVIRATPVANFPALTAVQYLNFKSLTASDRNHSFSSQQIGQWIPPSFAAMLQQALPNYTISGDREDLPTFITFNLSDHMTNTLKEKPFDFYGVATCSLVKLVLHDPIPINKNSHINLSGLVAKGQATANGNSISGTVFNLP
jgi:hypothetical protein